MFVLKPVVKLHESYQGYDFFNRLWAAVENNIKPYKKKRKRKPKKGKKGEKAPTTTPGRIMRLVKWMMQHLDK